MSFYIEVLDRAHFHNISFIRKSFKPNGSLSYITQFSILKAIMAGNNYASREIVVIFCNLHLGAINLSNDLTRVTSLQYVIVFFLRITRT
jgi:hypothetical protein